MDINEIRFHNSTSGKVCMTPQQHQQEKNEVLDVLRRGECSIIYEKLNGDLRTATGTLREDLIPVEFLPKHKVSSEVTPLNQTEEMVQYSGLVHYFDLVSKGWRNFYMQNLKSISYGESKVESNG
jgi:hypothetical protein